MAHILRSSALFAALSAGLYQEDTVGASNGTGTQAQNPPQATPAPTPAPVVIPEGMRGQQFHFRREKIKAEGSEEVIEVFKHPTVTIPLPVPTVEELKAIFNAPTQGEGARAVEQKYILDLIFDAYYDQVREQINAARDEAPKTSVSADTVDYSKLTILALASMPASERGSKVSEEDMAAFLQDYSAIMPEASGKDPAKIKAQAGILEKGLRTVRTDKKVLEIMEKLLTIWAGATQNMEEHQEVYEMLTNRIKKWLATEPKNVLDSIM
jgi:hypothetical protein